MLSEYLQLLLIWICVNKIHTQSYHSSRYVGGIPIILDTDRYMPTVFLSPEKPDTPNWVNDLGARIERLVSRHGYEGAKPFIKKTVEDAEFKRSVLLNVKGQSTIYYKFNKPVLRAVPDSDEENKDDDKARPLDIEPEWLQSLRTYVVKLIGLYGRKALDKHLRPVILSLQERHRILITDIDVDSFGNVMIKYKQDKKKDNEKNDQKNDKKSFLSKKNCDKKKEIQKPRHRQYVDA